MDSARKRIKNLLTLILIVTSINSVILGQCDNCNQTISLQDCNSDEQSLRGEISTREFAENSNNCSLQKTYCFTALPHCSFIAIVNGFEVDVNETDNLGVYTFSIAEEDFFTSHMIRIIQEKSLGFCQNTHIFIIYDATLNVSISYSNASPSNCEDGSITVNIDSGGEEPYKYSINGGQSYFTSNSRSYTFSGLSAGNYNIKVKSDLSDDCTYPTSGNTVTLINPNLEPPNIGNNVTICKEEEYNLPEGGCSTGSIMWYDSESSKTPLLSSTVSPITSTTYYALCKSGDCESDRVSFRVNVDVVQEPILPSSPTICRGEDYDLPEGES